VVGVYPCISIICSVVPTDAYFVSTIHTSLIVQVNDIAPTWGEDFFFGEVAYPPS